MIKIALCDDNKLYIDRLKQIVMNYLKEQEIEGIVHVFFSGEELLESQKIYDIYILDIEMRRVNGIEAGRIIRQMQASAIIIFLTVSKQYALEGYEAEPLRYLLKEDNEEKQKIQIEPVLNLAIKRMKEEEKSILLHKNGQVFSIKISSIMYVDIFRHQCTFHIKDGTVYKENYSLKGAEQKLDDPRFVRCHKSYLVNIQHIQHIEKNNIIMNNGEKVYLSRGKAKLIKCAILDYWGQ